MHTWNKHVYYDSVDEKRLRKKTAPMPENIKI